MITRVKYFDWNEEKNIKLKNERDISFEDVLIAVEEGQILDTIDNKKKYLNQKVFVINIDSYVYLVPFVEDDKKIFLKTVIPSRKATKKYLINKEDKK